MRDRWSSAPRRPRSGELPDELLFRFATSRLPRHEDARLAERFAASPEDRRRLREVANVLVLTADSHDELSFGAGPSTAEIVNASRHDRGERARRSPWRRVLLAAAILAAVSLVPLARRLPLADWAASPLSRGAFGHDEFATELEPATVGLRDGSVVRLAPETRFRVHARGGARDVSLAGRGYFAVAENETPFTIRTDASTVTVLGTRFDLTANGDDLRLIVIEGRVRLSTRGADVDVRAGQLAQILKGNIVPPIDVPDPAALVAWVGNFIAFQSTPLGAVAREIEQLHGVPVEITDPQLEERTVTALFAGRDLDEIVEVVCAIAHLRCTQTDDVVRMAPFP